MDNTAKTTMADILSRISSGKLLNQEILKIFLQEAGIENFSVEPFSNSGTDLCIKLFESGWTNDVKTFIKIEQNDRMFNIISADADGFLHELIVPSWELAILEAIAACKNIDEWLSYAPVSKAYRTHRFLKNPNLLKFLAMLPVSVNCITQPVCYHTGYVPDDEPGVKITCYNNAASYYYLGNGLWVKLSNTSFEERCYDENRNYDEFLFDTRSRVTVDIFLDSGNKYAEAPRNYESIMVGDHEIHLTNRFSSKAIFGKRIANKHVYDTSCDCYTEDCLLSYLKDIKGLMEANSSSK